MRTVNYKYDIGERVRIIDVEAFGRVDSLSTDSRGELYRVVFWMNGNRQDTWMYDWELTQDKQPQNSKSDANTCGRPRRGPRDNVFVYD